MRILIPVFFHAPMGGLHHHVLASTRHLLTAGHDITIVCKRGPFAEKASALGVDVMTTDFTADDVHRLLRDLSLRPFDIVYAHPFDSRQIGLAIAEVQQIPFVLVIHGMYDDDLAYYAEKTTHVIAVSQAIAEYLFERCPGIEKKTTVLMNGVDHRYTPTPLPPSNERIRATYVSRMDADMVFPLDVLLDGIGDNRLSDAAIDWTFIGSGTQREKYETRFKDVLDGTNQSIDWVGWLETEDVIDAMRQSDFVVAPSRAAIESLALGRPTLAIGSKGYHGLITKDTWQAAEATNFGGIGTRQASYRSGMVGAEIIKLFDPTYREDVAAFSASLAQRYRDADVQSRLERLLEQVIEEGQPPSPLDYAVARYEQLHLHRANGLLARRLSAREKKLRERRNL
ncbi:glycosyltransferase family 4 protein [Exiguobacterium sp. AM39-5BH]|uniref:glycosyltransferase family 4 protein n=1 Tax=Exiguobacterium sp. AM39-5BH TaxID=2292355 RepID=UPI000FE1C56D|nr:glycosyltransferase family 4 protein [Exiguobacterium sp. AM39-5BH]RHB49658.1 glycosyltransferase [Exiguobacterium sp. AM39-5BH]